MRTSKTSRRNREAVLHPPLNPIETLKRHLPINGPESMIEIKKIIATDYLRKISLKMLSFENTQKNPGGANPLPPNVGSGSQNPPDLGALGCFGRRVSNRLASGRRSQRWVSIGWRGKVVVMVMEHGMVVGRKEGGGGGKEGIPSANPEYSHMCSIELEGSGVQRIKLERDCFKLVADLIFMVYTLCFSIVTSAKQMSPALAPPPARVSRGQILNQKFSPCGTDTPTGQPRHNP
ncbi:Mediator of RNA polymerase II transcription subunit 15a [Acorus calamus]|uniref:Mediator of RNA polymerase II transcription subunit 15a n=1 Tax=Acorus calamus TaxID=4465 RepID=A0AAV9EZ19_ACOCL|nr:Mediator of RNA polymerase II transcription subunit 15a [Acorus calamus]